MKFFIIDKEEKRKGPFSIDELKAFKITGETIVWHDGLDGWKKAEEIEELKEILIKLPPPFIKKTTINEPIEEPINEIQNQENNPTPLIKTEKKSNFDFATITLISSIVGLLGLLLCDGKIFDILWSVLIISTLLIGWYAAFNTIKKFKRITKQKDKILLIIGAIVTIINSLIFIYIATTKLSHSNLPSDIVINTGDKNSNSTKIKSIITYKYSAIVTEMVKLIKVI